MNYRCAGSIFNNLETKSMNKGSSVFSRCLRVVGFGYNFLIVKKG